MFFKGKIKNFYIVLLECILLLCTITCLLMGMENQICKGEVLENNIADKYYVGETIEIPDANLSYNEKDAPASISLHLPNGIVTSNRKVVLNLCGLYTIQYKALIDNKLIVNEKKFEVVDKLYSTSSNKSSVSYGAHTYAQGKKGIVVNLAKGDTFYYNRIIDLNGKTFNDEILKMFVTPSVIGQADTNAVQIILTDAYDSKNSIKIDVKTLPSKEGWCDKNVYVSACGTGQLSTGIDAYSGSDTSFPLIMYKGAQYRLHSGNKYGRWTNFSLLGTPASGNIGDEFLTISYDYNSKQIYSTNKVLVTDLDEPLFYKNIWKGFSTGEVYMSIKGVNQQKDKFGFVITKIDNEDLTQNETKDTTPPKLDIDFEGYKDVPNGIVGLPYKVFNATASDSENGNTAVKVEAFYKYGTGRETTCKIINGEIIPKYAGEYTLIYSSKDYAGNIVKKEVKFTAIKGQDLDITLNNKVTSGEIGKEIKCADYVVSSPFKENNVNIKAVLKSDNSIIYNVDNNLSFIPLYAGEYSIEYEYYNYVQKGSKSYTITILDKNNSLINENINLPKFFIQGEKYLLPKVNGYIFENGKPVEKEASISFRNDGGKLISLNGNEFIPNANNFIDIVYTLVNGNGEPFIKEIKNIKTIKTNIDDSDAKIDMAKYFYTTQFSSVDKSNNMISFYTDNNKAIDGKAEMTFINPVLMADMELVFNGIENYTNFNEINIYFTDVNNENNQIKFTYKPTSNGVEFSINDGEIIDLPKKVDDSTANFKLHFDNFSCIVNPTNEINIKIEKNLLGNSFNGFGNCKAYIKMELEGISGNSAISVVSMNGQYFSKLNYDLVRPKISMNTIRGDRLLGDKILLKATYVGDILDPNTILSMKVTAPDKSIVKDINGISLNGNINTEIDYEFIVTQYGRYTISYSAKDKAGNVSRYSYTINVIDFEPPMIKLEDVKKETSVGQEYTIAKYNISDNRDNELEVSIYYLDSLQTMHKITGNKFTPKEKGIYTINYYVCDLSGNTTVLTYDVVVK